MGLLSLTVKQLVKLGYPESTAKKIVSGELPMDAASRMARAREQGYNIDMPLYHWSDVEGIKEMIPSTRGKIGPGVYTSPRYEYGKRYTASDDPFLYEMFRRGESPSQDVVSASLDQARNELNAIGDKWDSTTWKARANKILEDQGYTGKEVYYTGGEGLPLEVTSFSGEDLRRVDAAFDPDQVGSANLLASGKAPTVTAGLMGIGALSQGQDALLSPAESAYLKEQDKIQGLFDSDAGYDRLDVLPIRVNKQTGERELATPQMIKGLLEAMFDTGQASRTGVTKPTSIWDTL